MATIITSECINCGACEPECPNTAIYGGGVAWELNGETHQAISQDIYYIVPSKCTECVGFYDHEACAAVCPVDCCIPDPKNLESESVLFERAKVLHPEKTFEADFPSRFKKVTGGENGAAQQHEATEATNGAPASAAAAPPPTPVLAQTSAPVAYSDEFDPNTWAVPMVCHHCNEQYTIPFRHFQVGVMFYCPSCSGSFVATMEMYKQVRDLFENFYSRRKRERELYERRRLREQQDFETRQTSELAAFKAGLQTISDGVKPAGKMVRRRGLAAMFS
jgi:ferredoxin